MVLFLSFLHSVSKFVVDYQCQVATGTISVPPSRVDRCAHVRRQQVSAPAPAGLSLPSVTTVRKNAGKAAESGSAIDQTAHHEYNFGVPG